MNKYVARDPHLPGAATSTDISYWRAGLEFHFGKRDFRLISLPSCPQGVIKANSFIQLHISIALMHTDSITRTIKIVIAFIPVKTYWILWAEYSGCHCQKYERTSTPNNKCYIIKAIKYDQFVLQKALH